METKVYIYRIEKEYIEEHLEEITAALPEWRRKKVEKLRRTGSKVVSAAAGSFLYHVLEKEYGISSDELQIKEGEKGKPETDKVFFNISHSGDYIALAVSDGRVGVDIEYKNDPEGRIARRFFTTEEQGYIGGSGEADAERRFRRIWTMKESCIKLTGAGLAIPLKSIPVDPDRCTADMSGFPEYGVNIVYFSCHDFMGEDGKEYAVAVCTENILKNTKKYLQYYGCIFSE